MTHDENTQLAQCALALGHVFEKPAMLREALTHRSYVHEHPESRGRDNERLEFLGDAVLSLIMSHRLWDEFPAASEGELTRRRAELVSERGLASVAGDLQLGDFLLLGKGEENSGGRSKSRLLCSALEACIAAIYLDGGMDAAVRCVSHWFGSRIAQGEPGLKDYKSRAQEEFQSRGTSAPVYELSDSSGPDHDKTFFVTMRVDETIVSSGSGKSKSEAEQRAAEAALQRLAEDDSESLGDDH